MGMKYTLRALDQALETAEVERKYLRDELEAERVEKQRLAAEMDELRKMAREPKADRDRRGEVTAYIRDNWAKRSKRRAKHVTE